MVERLITSIVVRQRHRRDFSGVPVLVASIKRVGLLQPPGITPEGVLLWGECRLRACRELGWTTIPVIVLDGVDPNDRVAIEAAENFARKDFTPSEAVSIKRDLEPQMKAEAAQRMKAGKPSAKFAEGGETRAKAAALTGYSHASLAKAEAVVEAAERDPERFGKLAADMDRTGRVHGPFQRLKVVTQADAIKKEPPPLPGRGPYRVIVVDPPWPYDIRSEDPMLRGTYPYPQMSLAQIRALDVASIAHADAVLFLWTTSYHMRESYAVLDAWGFESKTILTWGKDRCGTGGWLRGQTEHCHMAVRGKPTVTLTNQSTLLRAPATGHSVKPEAFYALVESLCPAPRYCELFARKPRPGWDGHGNEIASPCPPDDGFPDLPPELDRREAASDPSSFAPTTKKQFDRAVRKAVAEREAEIRAEVHRAYNETIIPHSIDRAEYADEFFATRNGVMTRDDFRKIVSCLHPDTASPPWRERCGEAFALFKSFERLLVKPEPPEVRPSDLPRTIEELLKRRKAAP
jgi:N6-adenosine-specific RNA methylase IME4